jgi:putative peptidoglycan lipid II flippase
MKVLSAASYAKKDMKGPVQIATLSLFLNIGLNTVLMQYLAHAGLALSTSIAATVSVLLLYIRMRRKHRVSFQKDWSVFGMRVALANIAMGVALYWLVQYVGDLSAFHFGLRGAFLVGFIITGVVVYAATLLLCGFRPRHVLKPIPVD